MLIPFQQFELLTMGVAPGAASNVIGAAAVPLVVMSTTSPYAGPV